jgi:eukaryotic-like serine/threonine-protein kinase
MTVVELTRTESVQHEAVLLDWRYRLDALAGRVGGTSLWRAADLLLCRPVTVYLLPAWRPVPPRLAEAVQACARVNDPRLATVFDVDYDADRRYIVSEWISDPDLEQLLRGGLPGPVLATTIVAEAAEALAVAHQAGRPHLRLSARCVHWGSSGLKITGLGIDAALAETALAETAQSQTAQAQTAQSRAAQSQAALAQTEPDHAVMLSGAEAAAADTTALAKVLYALLTGCWPGGEPTALPPAPRQRTGLCEPRQLRPEVPPMLNAIVCHALGAQPAWGTPSISTPAQLAAALRGILSGPCISTRLALPARHARNCPDGANRPVFRAA